MKKIFLIMALLVSPLFTFASEQVSLTAPSNVAIGEEFFVTLQMENTGSLDIQTLEIAGMKDFQNSSQSTQTKFASINGISKSTLEYSFGFTASREGKYLIGPARIVTSSGEIWSNTGEIIVGSSLSGLSDKTKISPNSDLPHGLYEAIPLGKYFLWVITCIIFGIFFFFLLKNYLFRKSVKEEVFIETPLTQDEIFIGKFRELGEKREQIERFTFYTLFNKLLREYFESQGLKNSEKMTYEELVSHGIFHSKLSGFKGIFQKSYYHEFSKESDDYKGREELIRDVISHIKK